MLLLLKSLGIRSDVARAFVPAMVFFLLFLGSWGKGVQRAADEYDGWIASGAYRSTEEVVAAHSRYRASGGGRAIVSTIQVNGETDLGALRDDVDFWFTPGSLDLIMGSAEGETEKIARDWLMRQVTKSSVRAANTSGRCNARRLRSHDR